ncbi:hypothetical protein Q7C_861 [Methylophaga frappieri]|uniref:DUF721 domain-containing protein n=1 Tax=Methylophaga frappieri (strain ATCC BAA-2434 / DSM 25690 / JAM7) TaxID=754477 RepID=I1YGI7_METFJ|nr:DciA family protein [Methylophaga frappieri]AFJ02030.1 hypothetical protein Q7C_861 [Methylophaga frappieri]
MSEKPRLLSALFQHHPHLLQLHSRAQKLTQLDYHMQAILPANFAGRCRLVNRDLDHIMVIADTAAIASLLRFQSRKICQHLSDQLHQQISKMTVKVRPDFATLPARPRLKNQLKLTHEHVSLLEQTAEQISDIKLKTALFRLAKRGSKT